MALINRQQFAEAGFTPSLVAAAAGGDTIVNDDGKTILHVVNGGGASINVTITAQTTNASNNTFGSLTKGNIVVAVPAGQQRFIGPFPKAAFNQTNGQVAISYSAVTSVTVAAYFGA